MLKNTWLKIKGGLSESLPPHTISTWFDPITPIALDKHKIVLEVPNKFFYDWIESHYSSHIETVMGSLGLNEIKTKFIISAETGVVAKPDNEDLTPLKRSPLIPVLNKEHNFDTFIEGANNQFAKTAQRQFLKTLVNSLSTPSLYTGVPVWENPLVACYR